jgi:Holliday junction resolvase RusA-like endonuclease
MISFLCEFKPRSVQAKRTNAYKEAIVTAYKKYYPECETLITYDLYAISYYFYKRSLQIDADNLSKPIWDALKSTIYEDDRVIKIRYSGVYDVNKLGSGISLDVTQMPANVYSDFIDLIDSSEHLLYVEIGKINDELYKMGVEK